MISPINYSYGQDGCAARESAFWLRRANVLWDSPPCRPFGQTDDVFFPHFININIIISIIINNINITNIINIPIECKV